MSDRIEYDQKNGFGIASNGSATVNLIANPGSVIYLSLEKVVISVFEAAVGGGGIFELKDTNGDVIHTISTDSVKDVPLDYGDEGLKIGPGVGLDGTVSGAATTQASVSVAVTGHLTFRRN